MSSSSDPAPGSRRRWAIFTLGCLGFVMSMFFRVSTGVISPDVCAELGLSSSQMGLVSSAFFYAFAICQIPLIMALTRYGPRLTMVGLALFAVGGALLFSRAHSYQELLVGRALLGIGMSCNLMGVMALLAAWFPVNLFATLSGLLLSAATFGNLAAATPLSLLAAEVGWRNSFVVMAAVTGVIALGLFIIARDHPPGAENPHASGGGNPLAGIGRVFTMFPFWGVSLATFIRYGCFVALQGLWAVPFLQYGLGFSNVAAGNVLVVLSIGSIIGSPLLGGLSDRVLRSRKWVSLPGLGISALLVFALIWFRPGGAVWPVYAVFFLMGVFWQGPGLVMYAHIKELSPDKVTSAAMTSVNFFTMLGAALMTQAVGFMVGGKFSGIHGPEVFHKVWWIFAAALVLAALVYLFIPDSQALRQRDAEEEAP